MKAVRIDFEIYGQKQKCYGPRGLKSREISAVVKKIWHTAHINHITPVDIDAQEYQCYKLDKIETFLKKINNKK